MRPVKATKEAKRRTSWVNPSEAYDEAMRGFVRALLAPDGPFLAAFRPFQGRVAANLEGNEFTPQQLGDLVQSVMSHKAKLSSNQ